MTEPGKPDPYKAATLAGALPWLKAYHGKVVVVKYGGNAMTDDTLKRAFAEDIAFLRFAFSGVMVCGLADSLRHVTSPYDCTGASRIGARCTAAFAPCVEASRAMRTAWAWWRTQLRITISRPKVATTSLHASAQPGRALTDNWNTGSPNIRCAAHAPRIPNAICTPM